MASTDAKKSSRFSTFKVFGFTSSKPPPPPPKDAHYLYASSSRNPSVASFSNQSVLSPDSDPQFSTCKSIRSPSPAPSRMLQPQLQPEQHQSQQSPPASILTLSRSRDPSSSTSSKKGFFRKVSSFRKRSASKNSRVTNIDDATDDESISLPWNVQVTPHPHRRSFPRRPSRVVVNIGRPWLLGSRDYPHSERPSQPPQARTTTPINGAVTFTVTNNSREPPRAIFLPPPTEIGCIDFPLGEIAPYRTSSTATTPTPASATHRWP
ncbi:hypothetical protein EDB83DRAFT_1919118 [Lactarius deliciosus]|nr:hypothetical protein EDB83DRAFT_1919118 [Lactarius deliciosus]